MGWPDGERYSHPLQFLIVSLLSLVFTLLLSRTGGVLSHRNSLIHRFPRFPLGNLCFFVTLAVCSLVFAATDTAHCQALIALGLEESRMLHKEPANTRLKTPLISFCTVQLQTLCAAHSLGFLCDLWSRL